MFSRVLKSTNAQPPTVPAKEPSSSPTKRSAHTRTKSNGANVAAPASASPAMASPSKIPVTTTPSSRAATREAERHAKENTAPTNPYLASLQASSDPFTSSSGSSTPVKVKNITQPSIPHVPTTRSRQQQLSSVEEDVQMASATNRLAPAGLGVDPRMLKFNNGGGYGGYAAPPPPPMHQRSSAREVPRERVLQPWEREVLDRADVKRKATVAQIYFLDYYFDLLGYLGQRKKRLENFQADTAARALSPSEYHRERLSYNGRERVLLRKRRTKLRVEQFRILAQVGQGGYGSVYLARKADTQEVCALKKMRKGTLAKMDEVKHVLVERDILTAVKTPWLVRLLYAFQDTEHVYLAMEYVPGGDFRTLLNNSGVLKEEHARFYAAEMFMGVNELHKLGYIHRDLKPENFLVDGTGHVKLTDFGLATGALNPAKIEDMKNKLDQVKDEALVFRSTLERRTMYRSMRMAEPRYADSVVGSPDYMPPEVLRGKTYTYSADYWSLGCILFEFLCGFPPFSGQTPNETWANLKNWPKVLRRPVYDRPEDLIFNLSDVAWDAVTSLIAHPKDRVATLSDCQTLPFFQSLPFNSLRERDAPFVPMLDGETDVGYFDSFENEADMAKYAEVFKKQRDVAAVEEKGQGGRNNWVGFTFGRHAQVQQPTRGPKPEGEALQTIF